MAKGFAAGLAQGLKDSEEQSLKRAQEDRIAAIQTADLGIRMDDQAIRREEQAFRQSERARAQQLRNDMAALWSSTYGAKEVEVTEPVPGAIPTDSADPSSAMVRTVKKQIMVNPGERTTEGRERDLAFFNQMTALRAKHGEFSPEQMKQAMEYGRFLEKEGVEDGLSKLILNNDPSGLAPIAKRLGVDPTSLTVESVNEDGIPTMILVAKDAGGNIIRKDLEDVLFSLGIKNMTESKDKKISRRKAFADIDYTEAKTDDAKADASYSRARASEAGVGKVNTAQKDYLPKVPTGETKPMIDPGAGNAKSRLGSLAESRGMSAAKADRWANEAHAKISAAAQQRVDAEEEKSGKKMDSKTYNERFTAYRNKLLNDYIDRVSKAPKQENSTTEAE